MAGRPLPRGAIPALAALGAGILLLKLLLLSRRAFNWDELHLLAVSWRTGQSGFELTGRPGLMQVVLAPLTALPVPHEGVIGLARGLAWGISGAVYALVGLLGRALFGPAAGALALALLLTETTFLERSVEVRTDTPACALALAGAWAATRWRSPPGEAAGFGLMGIAALFSQKALYPAAAWGVARVLLPSPTRLVAPGTLPSPASPRVGSRALPLAGLLAAGGAVAAWYGLVAWIAPGSFPEFVGRTVVGALGEARDPYYVQAVGWRWALQGLARNPVFWGIPLVAAVLAAADGVRGASVSPERRAALAVAAAVLAMAAFHAARFPYLALTLAPPWAIACGPLLEDVGRRMGRAWGGPLLAAALLAPVAYRMPVLLQDQAADQRDLLARVEGLFPPETPYWDPNDLLFRHPNEVGEIFTKGVAALTEGGPEAWEEYEGKLRSAAPVFYVWSWRVRDLPRAVRRFLADRYVRLHGNLYVSGFQAGPEGGPSLRRELLAAGPYRVRILGAEGLDVDGLPVADGGIAHLPAGWHRFDLREGTRMVRVRWHAEGIDAREDPERRPRRLYHGYRR